MLMSFACDDLVIAGINHILVVLILIVWEKNLMVHQSCKFPSSIQELAYAPEFTHLKNFANAPNTGHKSITPKTPLQN